MPKGWKRIDFDGSRLKALREMNGLSQSDVATATKVSLASIREYENGKCDPGIYAIVSLADFYRVPVDYILGRTDMLGDPKKEFVEARKEAFEQWLVGGKRIHVPRGYEAPYPYSLVEEIFGKEPESIMTDDQVAGLEYALSTLSEREQKAIRLYYKEEKNLEETGKEFNVTRERVRQILAKGVRKLRHKSRSNYILYGLEGCNARHETVTLERMIEKENELHDELDMLEKAYEERKAELQEKFAAEEMKKQLPEKTDELHIDDLELSVRSYNCLCRADLRTVGKICEAAEKGQLDRVRNLGRKSLVEILERIKEMTGKSYFEIYGIT